MQRGTIFSSEHLSYSLYNIWYRIFFRPTQLNALIKERMRYAEFPDSIIAYTLKVTFKGRIGKLGKEEFERTSNSRFYDFGRRG